MKEFPKLYPDSHIRDHNVDGFDSVDSEDFDPGFGCVPVLIPRVPMAPPVVKNKWPFTMDKWDRMTGAEKDKWNEEQLKKMGL